MVSKYRIRLCVTTLAPLIFSPLLFLGKEYECVFCILLMSSYWIMEVVPIGITSLLPIFLFPILSIESAKQISLNYFKDSVILFMCTLVMALAVEETGLHRRVALKLLCLVGARKQTMLFGFMLTTSFISFFVSDTACTTLMLPIALAILNTMNEVEKSKKEDGKPEANRELRDAEKSSAEALDLKQMGPEQKGFCKALVLSCSHASLIGGTAIITSTGPNILFREMIQTFYPDDEVSVSYLQWATFAMPPMVLYLAASYIVLTVVFIGPRHLFAWIRKPTEEEEKTSRVVEKNVRQAYEELGRFTFAEMSVMFWFLFLMATWIMRKPGFVLGWADLLQNDGKMVTDSVPGILVVFIMFVWPKDPWCEGPAEPILNWSSMKRRFSWSCMLLIGAGYAISAGVTASGLSTLISCTMRNMFKKLESIWLQLVATASICFVTEFASNAATGGIFIPIVLTIAESLHVHPLYLALPTTIACSFAFMLPMATPPNAVVYDTRIISMLEMVSTGIFLNILCICITVLNMNTWAYWLFDMSELPPIPTHRGNYNTSLVC